MACDSTNDSSVSANVQTNTEISLTSTLKFFLHILLHLFHVPSVQATPSQCSVRVLNCILSALTLYRT